VRRLHAGQVFESEGLDRDIGARSVGGGLAMFGSQGAMFLVQLAGTVILARLLTPDDYGLIAMTAVVTGFAKMFRDAGLTAATVQSKDISHDQVSTLFWVNMAVIAALGVCILASAPFVAAFYRDGRVTAITAVLAVAFVVNGLSIQHDALLKRHMMFSVIAAENVLALIMNVVACVALAVLGFGYWALVAGPCVSAVVTTGMSFYYCPWIPGRPRRATGARRMLAFGGNVTGFNVANYFSRNMDNILIGRYIGADSLGLYSKAYSLFMLPLTQIRGPMTEVAMPALSSIRFDPERFRQYYLRLVDAMSTLAVPLAAICLVEADFVIRLVLGPKWIAVVPVFRLLAVVGLIQAPESTRAVVLLSLGESRKHLNWGVANAIVTVTAFAIGLRWGIVGVAAGYVAASYLMLFPNLIYSFSGTPVSVSDFLRAVMPAVLAAAAASGAAVGITYVVHAGWLLEGLAGSVAFVVVYFALSYTRAPVRANLGLLRGWIAAWRPAAGSEGEA
jgi:O-antigen/teichoic acid export membrane protein